MSEEQQYLISYALKLLACCRYTVAEMKSKLIKKQKKIGSGTPEDIKQVANRLQDLKLLDDAQYAALYIRDHLLRKPQGIKLLKLNMARKGLPKEIIAQALEAASPDESILARKAAAKKIKTLQRQPSQKKKERLARFLASRGFGMRSIIGILKSFPSSAEEDYQSP